MSRGVGLEWNPGLPTVRGLQDRWVGDRVGGEGGEAARVPSAHAQVKALRFREGRAGPCGKPGSGTCIWTSGQHLLRN